MKINEIINEMGEFGGDGDTDIQHGRHMRDALSDLAQQELVKMEEDPMQYFGSHGEEIDREQAQQIQQILGSVDDRTFDLMANSGIIIQSLENNSMGDGQSFIGIDAMMQVLQKVQARG